MKIIGFVLGVVLASAASMWLIQQWEPALWRQLASAVKAPSPDANTPAAGSQPAASAPADDAAEPESSEAPGRDAEGGESRDPAASAQASANSAKASTDSGRARETGAAEPSGDTGSEPPPAVGPEDDAQNPPILPTPPAQDGTSLIAGEARRGEPSEENAPDPPQSPAERAAPEPPQPAAPDAPQPAVPNAAGPDPAQQNVALAQPPAPTRESWQSFWRPFHTRNSASGFAAHLRKLTGLRIEVRERSPGEYIVVFPYADEQERQRHIQAIESETGFELRLEGSS